MPTDLALPTSIKQPVNQPTSQSINPALKQEKLIKDLLGIVIYIRAWVLAASLHLVED